MSDTVIIVAIIALVAIVAIARGATFRSKVGVGGVEVDVREQGGHETD